MWQSIKKKCALQSVSLLLYAKGKITQRTHTKKEEQKRKKRKIEVRGRDSDDVLSRLISQKRKQKYGA